MTRAGTHMAGVEQLLLGEKDPEASLHISCFKIKILKEGLSLLPKQPHF